jgi:hypothetical protein
VPILFSIVVGGVFLATLGPDDGRIALVIHSPS